MSSQTVVREVPGISDKYVAVLATCTLTRSAGTIVYQYKATYEDIWVFTPYGWRLIEGAPIDVSMSGPPGDRAKVASPPGGLAEAPCKLRTVTSAMLGPIDRQQYLSARGPIRAALVFVDSKEYPQWETPGKIYGRLAPDLSRRFQTESDGRATLEMKPIERWYTLTGLFGKRHIEDALNRAAADEPEISSYDVVYVIAPRPPSDQTTGASRMTDKFVVRVGDRAVRAYVTFDSEFGGKVLLHETLHLFGLPDLYRPGGDTSFVGAWDVMSNPHAIGGLLTAWSRMQLGWLDEDQLTCAPEGVTDTTLTPVATHGGVKAVIVPVSPSQAYVAELREIAGSDLEICREGVLIYRVDVGVSRDAAESWTPPMDVVGGPYGRTSGGAKRCGGEFEATFSATSPMGSHFEDSRSGVTIDILRERLGAYTVRVSRSAKR